MNVHYKIRFLRISRLITRDATTPSDLYIDTYVSLPEPMFSECRAEQLLNWCLENDVDPSTVTIIEDSFSKGRVDISLITMLKRSIK